MRRRHVDRAAHGIDPPPGRDSEPVMKNSEFPEIEAWRKLASSPTVREQQVAFTCATGVPLTLSPASVYALAEGTFCVKGCLGGHSGEACRRKLLQAEKRAVTRSEPVQYSCPSGLVKILVPVFINGRHAGHSARRTVGPARAGRGPPAATDGPPGKGRLGRPGGPVANDLALHARSSAPAKCQAAETLLRMFAKYLEEAGKQYLQSADRCPFAAAQKNRGVPGQLPERAGVAEGGGGERQPQPVPFLRRVQETNRPDLQPVSRAAAAGKGPRTADGPRPAHQRRRV